jgi:hypothetical protein
MRYLVITRRRPSKSEGNAMLTDERVEEIQEFVDYWRENGEQENPRINDLADFIVDRAERIEREALLVEFINDMLDCHDDSITGIEKISTILAGGEENYPPPARAFKELREAVGDKLDGINVEKKIIEIRNCNCDTQEESNE